LGGQADWSAGQSRVQRFAVGVAPSLKLDGDRSPSESADKSAHSTVAAGSPSPKGGRGGTSATFETKLKTAGPSQGVILQNFLRKIERWGTLPLFPFQTYENQSPLVASTPLGPTRNTSLSREVLPTLFKAADTLRASAGEEKTQTGLNQKLEEELHLRGAEIDSLKTRNRALEERLTALEKLVAKDR
jgi:hypothetical protein